MAARQKAREIELCNEEWQSRKADMKHRMIEMGKKRA